MVRCAQLPYFSLTAALAAAQFKSTATLVIAPTIVIDGKGNYVDGLEPRDLVLYDNGVAQPIQVDEAYAPISLVVAIQTSSSASAILDKLGTSGILFANLLAGDRGETAIVTFSDEVRVARNFTANSDQLKTTLGDRCTCRATRRSRSTRSCRPSRCWRARKPDHRTHSAGGGGEARPLQQDEIQRGAASGGAAERSGLLAEFFDLPGAIHREAENLKSRIRRTARPLPPETAPGNLLSIFTELKQQGKAEQLRATHPRHRRALRRVSSRRRRWRMRSRPSPPKCTGSTSSALRRRPAIPAVYHAIRIEVKGRPDLTARTRAGYWAL